MRIHTDTLTESDIYKAAWFARVDVVKLTRHGSKSRDHAYDVKLEGESRRRPNGGASGVSYGSGYAATWDQWGVFLSVLFDLDNGDTFDPSAPMTIPAAYADRDGFHERTGNRFLAVETVQGSTVEESTNANVINVRTGGWFVQHIADHYWPADAHGDHTFRFDGVPFEQSCTKCSAKQRWM